MLVVLNIYLQPNLTITEGILKKIVKHKVIINLSQYFLLNIFKNQWLKKVTIELYQMRRNQSIEMELEYIK